MKRRFLHLFVTLVGLLCGASQASAFDLDVPELPLGQAPTNGAIVMLYNIDEELCLGNGKISAAWATSTILLENGGGLLFKLEEQSDGTWSLRTSSGEKSGQFMFAPYAEGDRPYCFIDMAGDWQGSRKWTVEELPEGGYSLSLVDDMNDGNYYLGTNGMTYDVVWNADPDDGAHISWLFLEADAIQKYNLRIQLFEQLDIALAYPSIQLDPYAEVYNNAEATVEDLNTALSKIKSAIAEAMIIDDGIEATPDDPLDVTDMYIENARFDTDVNGWQNIGGMTKDPNSTPYGDTVQDFCEKWAWNTPLNGEFGIYQTLSLAPGLYRLEVDAIATAQYDQSIKVTGVKVYVKNETSYEVGVATADNSPQHYSIEFLVDGSTPTEVGFHCDKTTEANWICVDNFQLWYMGKVEMSSAQIQLKNAIATALNAYPEDEFDYIPANTEVKDTYTEALAAAAITLDEPTSTDEAYEAATAKLEEALAALNQSKADYATLQSLYHKFDNLSGALLEIDEVGDMEDIPVTYAGEIDQLISEAICDGAVEAAKYTTIYDTYNALYELILFCNERIEANGDDATLVGMIEAKVNALHTAWVEGTYTTPEQVAQAKDDIQSMIAAYLNAAIKPGDDLTYMIVNANFDENADGWDRNGYGNPGYNAQCVEYFQKNFNFSQTLKGMPKGRYTLTVQGYQRRSTVNAVLYANENEKLLWNVKDQAQDPGFYSEQEGYPYDSYDAAVGYYPNSMDGARAWFDAETEDGEPFYTNKLDFFLTAAESNDLTIGVRSSDNGDWCLFDNFTLVYHGNNASDYAVTLNELIEQIETLMEEGYPTEQLLKNVDAAKKQATDAIESNNADGCIAALPVLQNTLKETQETLAVTKKLGDKYAFMVDYRIDELVSSTKNDFKNYLDSFAGKLTSGGIKDLADVDALADELDTKFTECVQHDGLATATEAKPFDMTAAIVNPNYECWFEGEGGYNEDVLDSEFNAFGWEGDKPNCNEFSAEYFNMDWTKGVEIHQTIKGLAPGWYKLHVLGYNRQGYGNDHVEEPVSYTTLYAGQYSTRLCDVLDYKSEEKLCDADDESMNESEVEIDGVTYYYPGNMPSSAIYYEEGCYMNTLVFKVEEGQKEVTFGLSKQTFAYWDSLMFDTWSLDYVGTTEPTEVSTAIAGVSAAQGKAVYNLAGQRVNKTQKGINIIKHGQGAVKVLVK